MSETTRCPQCQAEIPAGAPEGLCPQCLLQAALQPPTAQVEPKTAAYSPSGSRFEPPTPAALQSAFPQLDILELLGKGGMGAVYKARQPGLDRLVAVKILPPEISQDPAFAERFTREARALAKLSHPNIVGVYDFGQASGYCYFVMEYVDGVNLRQAMRAGELKSPEALKIVPQICDALQFAHDEGIVHRDIKPENILLDKKGRVKIADFGLAKLMGKTPHDVSLTGTQQVMGTMHYMAPEQLEGSRDVDHRADIYSLGVTFYEMLTGELPIGRFAAPSKKVQIDVRLDEVVLRSLEKEPELRYQHASEIKTEVEGIVRTPLAAADAAPVGISATELEEIVLNNRQAKWAAINAYRVRTGTDLKDAIKAVEAIAQKHGIQFPPVNVTRTILAAIAVFLFLTCLVQLAWIFTWISTGVSPLITIPITLLLAVPFGADVWKKWGTPERYQTAVIAALSFILFTPAGILLVTFMVNPEPTLNHLYAVTGITPSPHDARFLQVAFCGGLLGMVAWLLWAFRKFLAVAEGRDGSKQHPNPDQPARSLEKEPEHRYQLPGEIKTEVVGATGGRMQEQTIQAPAPTATGGIPVSYYFKTLALAAVAWLLAPLLWNAREWGLAILCLMIGTFIVWRARGIMQFLPANAERWRQRSGLYRQANTILAVLMASAGVYFVFLAAYQAWERCHWNSMARTRDEFQRVYRGSEHHLLRHLPEFDKDMPRAELGMAEVPMTIAWNLSISNPPSVDLFATHTICVSFFMGILIFALVYVGFMDPGATWTWQVRWIWPALGLGLSTFAPVLPYGIILLIISAPAGYGMVGAPMVVNDDLPAVAAQLDEWATENGYETGDIAAGEVYMVPRGGKLATVQIRHLWRPNVFDRWEMTWHGLKSKAPDYAVTLIGNATAKQTVVLPNRRLFDPDQPAIALR